MLPAAVIHAMHRDRLLTSRVVSKTLSRFPMPNESGHAPYEIHLDVPELVLATRTKGWLGRRVIVARGPAQVIGSYSFVSGTFRWGFTNETLPSQAHALIAPPIRAVPELAELVCKEAFTLEDDFTAWRFACWIAAHIGWLGVPSFPTDGGVAFFAFKAAPPRASLEPADQVWCMTCGRLPSEARMWEFDRGYAICEACIEVASEVLAEFPPDADDAPPRSVLFSVDDGVHHPPSCVVCGHNRERMLAFDQAFIDVPCARRAMASLGGAPGR